MADPETQWSWVGGVTKGSTERRGLCICCSYPGTEFALPGTPPDQLALQKVLIDNGYAVTLLTDADSSKIQPTKDNIVRYMADLCAWLDAAPGRQGWISYSGHGTQQVDTSGDEIDGKDEAMVPTNFMTDGLLTDDELRKTLVFGKGSALMVFMDCCHSGAAAAEDALPEREPSKPSARPT